MGDLQKTLISYTIPSINSPTTLSYRHEKADEQAVFSHFFCCDYDR